MNEHMGDPMRDHMGRSDPRDNRYRRERMDGFLNQFGTPDDFSQERHHDISPPRDIYDRVFSGNDDRAGRPIRATKHARPRTHPNDRTNRPANRPDREEALTWTDAGENSGISMRAAC